MYLVHVIYIYCIFDFAVIMLIKFVISIIKENIIKVEDVESMHYRN